MAFDLAPRIVSSPHQCRGEDDKTFRSWTRTGTCQRRRVPCLGCRTHDRRELAAIPSTKGTTRRRWRSSMGEGIQGSSLLALVCYGHYSMALCARPSLNDLQAGLSPRPDTCTRTTSVSLRVKNRTCACALPFLRMCLDTWPTCFDSSAAFYDVD